MVVIAEVIRLVGWSSYLVAPGGAIADAMLLLSAFALGVFGRKAIRQTFDARTARRAGLSVTRFRPSVLTATFLLLTTTTLLVNVVVKSVIGPELTHREVASILNKEIADDVPFLSVRF